MLLPPHKGFPAETCAKCACGRIAVPSQKIEELRISNSRSLTENLRTGFGPSFRRNHGGNPPDPKPVIGTASFSTALNDIKKGSYVLKPIHAFCCGCSHDTALLVDSELSMQGSESVIIGKAL